MLFVVVQDVFLFAAFSRYCGIFGGMFSELELADDVPHKGGLRFKGGIIPFCTLWCAR